MLIKANPLAVPALEGRGVVDGADHREVLTLFELCEQGPGGPGLNARILYALATLGFIEREQASSGGIKIQVRG